MAKQQDRRITAAARIRYHLTMLASMWSGRTLTLHQPERDALLLYAHFLDPLDVSYADVQEALAEARRALYGELEDECDDGYDDGAFDEIESEDSDAFSNDDTC